MRGKKKKSIEELETEVKELIANSSRSEDDIHTDYNTYRALKKRIDNPDSCHYDEALEVENKMILMGHQISSCHALVVKSFMSNSKVI
jgi:hypothetical protein